MKTRSTTTQTLTREQVIELIETGSLSQKEELFLRMRHGISVSENMPLDMVGDSNPDVQAHLATIEREAVQMMMPQESSQPKRNRTREKIVDTLKKLS